MSRVSADVDERARRRQAPTGVARPVAEMPESPRTRRRGRVTVVALVVGLTATGLAFGAEWALHQPFLRAEHVSVVGNTHESAARVLAVSGLAAHPPMIDVSGREISERLQALPWIGGVTVVRRWPDTVVLHVRERAAVAVAFDPSHRLQYVDGAGHDLGPAPLDANLPTLVYDAAEPTWPYGRAGAAAAYVASQLPRAFAAQVSVVSEDASGDVVLELTTPVRFVLGPATNLRAKFISVASVIAHSTLRAGDVVDVTVPGELAVTGPPLT